MTYETCLLQRHPPRLVPLFDKEDREKCLQEVGLDDTLLSQVLSLPRMQKIAFISSFDARFKKFGLPKVAEEYREMVLARKVQFRNALVRSLIQ